jgi:predicted MFS family arabinose efflux permease
VLGPAVAGLTIGLFGIAIAFAINAVSFLAVIIGLAVMHDEELTRARLVPRPRSVGEVFTNLTEGLRYVRHTPIVLLAVTVVGLVATFGMNFQVLIPPLAQDVLKSDAAGYGFLMTASGVGALAAAVSLVVGGKPRPVRIALGGVVLGAASIALALSGSFPVSLILMGIVGAGGISMAATANATIQLSVPDGLRGRVMSVYTTVFAASVPVGGLAMGALASAVGIPVTIAVGGILSLVTGVAAFAWWQQIRPGVSLTQTPGPVPSAGLATLAADQTVPPMLPQALAAPGAPRTSAAFKPPKPNEVLSTRR